MSLQPIHLALEELRMGFAMPADPQAVRAAVEEELERRLAQLTAQGTHVQGAYIPEIHVVVDPQASVQTIGRAIADAMIAEIAPAAQGGFR